MRIAFRLLAPLVLAFLGGCFSLGRETTPLEQYVLGGVPAEEGTAASLDATGLALGLRRPDLAGYLAMPALVVREGPHRIVSSEFHRWAEELDEGINRELARHLSTRGGFRRIDVAPWAPANGHDYLIQVRVLRFEGVVPSEGSVSGGAHVLATWEIIRPEDGAVVGGGTTEHRESGWRPGDYATLVVLLDRGIDRLATDLAETLGSLPDGP
jgi:uncharacterized lipoprotein YmbA